MKRPAKKTPTEDNPGRGSGLRCLGRPQAGLDLLRRSGLRTADCRGSALIALIAAIVVFSLLAAAILPLVSSSSQQSASAGLATQAYLLAESGFRYAASRFLHAGATDAAKFDVLENLDGGNYTLDNNGGQFQLQVFSYFYEIVDSSGTTLTVHAPGTFPNTEINLNNASNRQVRIGQEDYTILSAQAVVGEDDNVTMSVDHAPASVPLHTPVYPVAVVSGYQTLTNGAALNYQDGDGAMFPLRNGQIQVAGQTLTYRLNDRAHNRLLDLQDPSNPALNAAIADGAQIVLNPYVRLVSIGRIGGRDLHTERQVDYFTPLPLSASVKQRIQHTETFESVSNWVSRAGSQAIRQTGATLNNALAVTGTSPLDTVSKTSLAEFHPPPGPLGSVFSAAYSLNGGYLDYDVQAKIGYYLNQTPPNLGYDPASPIPAYVAAGLSFRLSPVTGGTYNSYGVSFLRGNSSLDDAIPDQIVPSADQRVIVLWQQTANGADRKWLAYKNIEEKTPVAADFEMDDGNWTETHSSTEVYWHRSQRRPHNGSWSYYYGNGDDVTGNYDTGVSNNDGTLTYGPFTLCNDDRIRLAFYSWYYTEDNESYDLKDVQIRYDQGGGSWSAWTNLLRITPTNGYPSQVWTPIFIQLCAYAGRTVEIRFSFDTVDGLNNTREGWYIDDVRIICDWPIDEATLLVRQVEAAALDFIEGGPEVVQTGDHVFGNDSGAQGVVARPPLLTDDDWTHNNARGLLLLNRVSGVFQGGEELHVLGKGRRALLTSYDQNSDDHNNFILVYYARPQACGTPDNDPLDAAKEGYPRLPNPTDEVRWPPDEGGNWTAADDYFRLVQWDAVNDGNVTDLSAVDFISRTGELVSNALIRSYHSDLRSPPSGTGFQRPEVGLHTFGDGSLNVFFDDFGLQMDIRPGNIFTLPLQQ